MRAWRRGAYGQLQRLTLRPCAELGQRRFQVSLPVARGAEAELANAWESGISRRPPPRAPLPHPARPPIRQPVAAVPVTRELDSLLARATAQRLHFVQGSEEQELFTAVELSRAYKVAGELRHALDAERWTAVVTETHRLAEADRLDGVVLYLALNNIAKLKGFVLGPGKHRATLPALHILTEGAVGKTRKMAFRHLAGLAAALARLAPEVAADAVLSDRIRGFAVDAAEQLPRRLAKGHTVSGFDVAAVCESVRLLGLRSDDFLRLVCALLRQEWEMIWNPPALARAALCLSHFGVRDARAWRALAHRVVSDLPAFGVANLVEVALALARAEASSAKVNAALAERFIDGAADLSPSDVAHICQTCISQAPRRSNIDDTAGLAPAVVQRIPRQAADFGPADLRWVLEAMARWAAPRFGVAPGVLETSVQAVLSTLSRHVAGFGLSEMEALLGVLHKTVLTPEGSTALSQALEAGLRRHLAQSKAPPDPRCTAALLHHMSLLGVGDAAVFRTGIEACAHGLDDSSAAGWLASARLLALCGRAGVKDVAVLRHLVSVFATMHVSELLDREDTRVAALSSVGLALAGLARLRVRPSEACLEATRGLLRLSPEVCAKAEPLPTTPPAVIAYPIVCALFELGGLPAAEDFDCAARWFADPGCLSTEALATICLVGAERLPWRSLGAAGSGCGWPEDSAAASWLSWVRLLGERLVEQDGAGASAPDARGSAERAMRLLAFAIVANVPKELAAQLATVLRLLLRDSGSPKPAAGVAPEVLDGVRARTTYVKEVHEALLHVLGRHAVRSRPGPQTPDTWRAAGGARGLVPNYQADLFTLDFALLESTHPPPLGMDMIVFYPKVARMRARRALGAELASVGAPGSWSEAPPEAGPGGQPAHEPPVEHDPLAL